MKNEKGILRTCSKGHRYRKSSDCPTCPVCEAARKPADGFFSLLAAPARRALEREKITTLENLSTFTENDILALHGMGKGAVARLTQMLSEHGLRFRGE